MFPRITPLLVLLATAMVQGCGDSPELAGPSSRSPQARKPGVAADLLVSVAGPTVLNTGNANDFTRPLGMNAVGAAVATVVTFVNLDAQDVRVLRWPRSSATGIDIGTEHATAASINSSGQIGGTVAGQAMLWTPMHGGTYQLTPVAGAISTLAWQSEVRAINDYGQVVGTYSSPKLGTRCFLWTPTSANATTGKLTVIPGLGGSFCSANAVNSAGYVAGESSIPSELEKHVFVWSPATPNGITGSVGDVAPGCPGGANAINDALQIGG